jgi:hypothetical protein
MGLRGRKVFGQCHEQPGKILKATPIFSTTDATFKSSTTGLAAGLPAKFKKCRRARRSHTSFHRRHPPGAQFSLGMENLIRRADMTSDF